MLQLVPNKSLKERMCKKVRKQRWEQMLDSLMIVVTCRAPDTPWAQGIQLPERVVDRWPPWGLCQPAWRSGSQEGIDGGSSGHVDATPVSLTVGDASGGTGFLYDN